MNLKKMFLIFNILFWLIFPSVVSAASYNYDEISDELIGAYNVLINNKYYNVTFQYGAAIEIWGENDAQRNEALTFKTYEEAFMASEALMYQVYNDNQIENSIDSDPTITLGIGYSEWGRIHTPYETGYDEAADNYYINTCAFVNENDDDLDWVGTPFYDWWVDEPLGDDGGHVYAKWQSRPVPEPATIFLLGLGLVGLTFVNRKKIETE